METRLKISARLKEKWKDPIYRERRKGCMPNRQGVAHSEETKARIAAAVKARWQDPAYREKVGCSVYVEEATGAGMVWGWRGDRRVGEWGGKGRIRLLLAWVIRPLTTFGGVTRWGWRGVGREGMLSRVDLCTPTLSFRYQVTIIREDMGGWIGRGRGGGAT